MTATEYLALERASDAKHEFLDGDLFAMSGGTHEHNLVSANFVAALHAALRGRPCIVYTSDMRVRSPRGLYAYPDVSALCGRPEFEDDTRDALLNPAVLVEVLSDSTEAYDRGRKFDLYRAMPSLRDYVLASQHEPLVEHFWRQPDGSWVLRALHPGDSLQLASLGCEVAVADLYLRVFETPTDG